MSYNMVASSLCSLDELIVDVQFDSQKDSLKALADLLLVLEPS